MLHNISKWNPVDQKYILVQTSSIDLLLKGSCWKYAGLWQDQALCIYLKYIVWEG